jgi:predicted DNA-binding transcriptional regulator AlpA
MDHPAPTPPARPADARATPKKRFVPFAVMLAQIGLARSTWYLKYKNGEDVPLPIRPFGGRMVRFEQTEIDAWIERRLAESRARCQ